MKKNGLLLPIVEHFYTLQGEGKHVGVAAYFVRIAGCNVACEWCDSKSSWNAENHKILHIDDILNSVIKTPATTVVITGGEPTMYNLEPLTNLLKKHGINVFLETSGTNNITGFWDWICLSPKQNMPPLHSVFLNADELKVVIYSDDDFLWAEQCAKKVSSKCLLFLQPEWSMYSKNIDKIVSYIKQNPQWRMSIQSHKFMKIQ